MNWHDAFGYIAKQAASKQMTNRDAAGLILFARAAQRLLEAHADPLNVAPSMAFDWYRSALLGLGWAKHGDQFVMTDKWQKSPYVDPTQLVAELGTLADMLDAQHVPFKMLRNPSGNAEAYKSMALDAYHLMQKLDPASADVHGPPMHKPGKPKSSGASSPASKPKASDAVQPVSVEMLPPETPVATPAPTSPHGTHVVQPPPMVIDHPDGGQVTVTPPPVIVPSVAAAPSGGDAASIPGPGVTVPVAVTPPPLIVPPIHPNGAPYTVQPPPVVAEAPVIPHPSDANAPGDWYWKKHAHDDDAPPVIDMGGEVMDVRDAIEAAKKKKPKKDDSAGDGAGAGILLLLAVLAFGD